MFRLIAAAVSVCVLETAVFPDFARAGLITSLSGVPYVPGQLLKTSTDYSAPLIKGLKLNPHNPFEIDFILDAGETDVSQEEALRLAKYFFAIVTTPEKDLWVNLSPVESDRVMEDHLAVTDMGRDMLLQDYLLKQLAASMTYPQDDLGKKFWERVYQKIYENFGHADVPMDVLSKVWIVPEFADVYAARDAAFIVDARLDVMLDKDYQMLRAGQTADVSAAGQVIDISAQVAREIILPEIRREINEGKNFAPVRQMFHSLVLALWFKANLKNNLINRIYGDREVVDGLDIEDKDIKRKVYEGYLEAFRQGVYNFVQDDYDPNQQQIVARQYYSGGILFGQPSFAGDKTAWMRTVADAAGVYDAASLADPRILAIELAPSHSAQRYNVLKRDAAQLSSGILTRVRMALVGLLLMVSIAVSAQKAQAQTFETPDKTEFFSRGDTITDADRPAVQLVQDYVDLQDVLGLDGKVNPVTQQPYDIDEDYFKANWDNLFKGGVVGWAEETVIIAAQEKLNAEQGAHLDVDGDLGFSTISALLGVEDDGGSALGNSQDQDGGTGLYVSGDQGFGSGGSGGGPDKNFTGDVSLTAGLGLMQGLNALGQDDADSDTTGLQTFDVLRPDFVLPPNTTSSRDNLFGVQPADTSDVPNIQNTRTETIHAPDGLLLKERLNLIELPKAHRVIQVGGKRFFTSGILEDIEQPAVPAVVPPTPASKTTAPAPAKTYDFKIETGGLWNGEAGLKDGKLDWTERPGSFFLKYTGLFPKWGTDFNLWARLDGGVHWGEQDGQSLKHHRGGQLNVDLSKMPFANKNGLFPRIVLMHYDDAGKFNPTGVMIGNKIKMGEFTLSPQFGGFTVKDGSGIEHWRAGAELNYKKWTLFSDFAWPDAGDLDWYAGIGYSGKNTKIRLARGWSGTPDASGKIQVGANNTRYKGISGMDRPAPGGLLQLEQNLGAFKFKGWMGLNNEFRLSTVGVGLDLSGKDFKAFRTDFIPQMNATTDFWMSGDGIFSNGYTFAGLQYHQLTFGILNHFDFAGTPDKLKGFLSKPVLMAEINSVGLGSHLLLNAGIREHSGHAGISARPVTFGNFEIAPRVQGWNLGVKNTDGDIERDWLVSADFPVTAHLKGDWNITATPSVYFYNGGFYADGRVEAARKNIYVFAETGQEQDFFHPMGLQDPYEARFGAGLSTKTGTAEIYYGTGDHGGGIGIRTTTTISGKKAKADPLPPDNPFEQALTSVQDQLDTIPATLSVDGLSDLGVASVDSVLVSDLKAGMFLDVVWTRPDTSEVEQIGQVEEIFVDTTNGAVAVKYRPIYTTDPVFHLDGDYVYFEARASSDPLSGLKPYVSDGLSASISAVYQSESEALETEGLSLKTDGEKADIADGGNVIAAEILVTGQVDADESEKRPVKQPSAMEAWTQAQDKMEQNDQDDGIRIAGGDPGDTDAEADFSDETQTTNSTVDIRTSRAIFSVTDKATESVDGASANSGFQRFSAQNARLMTLFGTMFAAFFGLIIVGRRKNKVIQKYRSDLYSLKELTRFTTDLLTGRQRALVLGSGPMPPSMIWNPEGTRVVGGIKAIVSSQPLLTELHYGDDGERELHLIFQPEDVRKGWQLTDKEAERLPRAFAGGLMQILDKDGKEQFELKSSKASPHFIVLVFRVPEPVSDLQEITVRRPERLGDPQSETVDHIVHVGMSVINKIFYNGEMILDQGRRPDTEWFEQGSQEGGFANAYDRKVFEHFGDYYTHLNEKFSQPFKDYGRTAEFADKVLRQAGDFLVLAAEHPGLLGEKTVGMLRHFTGFARPLYDVVSHQTGSIDSYKRFYYERGDRPENSINRVMKPILEYLSLTRVWVAFHKKAAVSALRDVGFYKRRLDESFGRAPDERFTFNRLASGFYSLYTWWTDPEARSMAGMDAASRLNRMVSDVLSLFMIVTAVLVTTEISWDFKFYGMALFVLARLVFPLGAILTTPVAWNNGFYSPLRRLAGWITGFPLTRRLTEEEMRRQDAGLYADTEMDVMLKHYSGLMRGKSFWGEADVLHKMTARIKRRGYEISMRANGHMSAVQRRILRQVILEDLRSGVLNFPEFDPDDLDVDVHAYGVHIVLPWHKTGSSSRGKRLMSNVPAVFQKISFSVPVERTEFSDMIDALNRFNRVLDDRKADAFPVSDFRSVEQAIRLFLSKELEANDQHFRDNLAAYRKLRAKVDYLRVRLVREYPDVMGTDAGKILQKFSFHVYEVIRYYGEKGSADVEKRLPYFRGRFFKILRNLGLVRFFMDRWMAQAYMAAENVQKVGLNRSFGESLIKSNQSFDRKLMKPSPYIMLGAQKWRVTRRHMVMVGDFVVAAFSLYGMLGDVVQLAMTGQWEWWGLNLYSVGGFYILRKYFSLPLSGFYMVIKEYRQSLKGLVDNQLIVDKPGNLREWIELAFYASAILVPWMFPLIVTVQFARFNLTSRKAEDALLEASSAPVVEKAAPDPVSDNAQLHGGIDFGRNLDKIRIIDGGKDTGVSDGLPVINLEHFRAFNLKLLSFKPLKRDEALAALGLKPANVQLSYQF